MTTAEAAMLVQEMHDLPIHNTAKEALAMAVEALRRWPDARYCAYYVTDTLERHDDKFSVMCCKAARDVLLPLTDKVSDENEGTK